MRAYDTRTLVLNLYILEEVLCENWGKTDLMSNVYVCLCTHVCILPSFPLP